MRAALSLIATAALFTPSCVTSPLTGRKQLMLVSKEREVALGAEAYKQVLSEEEVLQSGPEVQRVNRVGTRIARATKKDFDWRFSVIKAPDTVNAFCLPGGKVAVYTGLLSMAETDDELAVVVGHEIAHATLRHGAERLSQEVLYKFGLTAADELLKSQDSQIRKLSMAALGVGGKVGFLLPYSRTHEYEADKVGLRYMNRAGYDPHAAVSFWEKMASKEGSSPPEFLSTHPATEKRLERLKAQAAMLKANGG